MNMAKKTVVLLMLFTLAFAAVYIIDSLMHYSGMMTSFPWWACFAFAMMYFGPVLAFEGILYGILILVEKMEKEMISGGALPLLFPYYNRMG